MRSLNDAGPRVAAAGSGTREVLDYILKAAEVRSTVESNIEDYNAIAAPDRLAFNYVFDTNVVVFYMDPVSEADNLAGLELNQEAGADPLINEAADPGNGPLDSAAAGVAICTAEYLFSRHLTGQYGFPIHMSDEHLEELVNKMERMFTDARERFRKDPRYAAAIEAQSDDDGEGAHITEEQRSVETDVTLRLGELAEEIIDIDSLATSGDGTLTPAMRHQREKVVGSIITNITEFTKESLGRYLMLQQTVKRVISTGSIIPLSDHAYYPHIDRKMIGNRSELFRSFKKKIEEVSKRDQSKSKNRNARLIDNDVKTILTLEAVNRYSEQVRSGQAGSVGDDDGQDNVLMIFVTADRTLKNAYEEWRYEQKTTHLPVFRCVRHVSQYSPMFNIKEMKNRVDDDMGIERIKDSLDFLFSNIIGADDNYPHSLPRLVSQGRAYVTDGKKSAADQKWDGILRAFREDVNWFDRDVYLKIREDWLSYRRDVLTLNLIYLQSRLEQLRDLYRSLDSSESIRQIILDLIEESLSSFSLAHVEANLLLCVSTLRARDVGKFERLEGSGLFMVFHYFDEWTGERSIRDFLRDLMRLETHDAIHAAIRPLISRIRESKGDCRGLFLAACIAFRCSQWGSAMQYAENAMEMLTKQTKVGRSGNDAKAWRSAIELRLFQCTATRYMIYDTNVMSSRTRSYIDTTNRYLDELVSGEWGELTLVDKVRIEIERATLFLQEAYFAMWAPERGEIGDEVRQECRVKAEAHTNRCDKLLRRLQAERGFDDWGDTAAEQGDTLLKETRPEVIRLLRFGMAGCLSGCIMFDVVSPSIDGGSTVPRQLARETLVDMQRDKESWIDEAETRDQVAMSSVQPPELYKVAESILSAYVSDAPEERKSHLREAAGLIQNHLDSNLTWSTPWDEELLPWFAREIEDFVESGAADREMWQEDTLEARA